MGTLAKIKIRAFPYYVDSTDPVSGKDIRVERVAMRGETVELSDTDLERAKQFDAIIKPEEQIPGVDESNADGIAKFNPSEDVVTDASVESLSKWIKEDKPTVDQVVEEANDAEEARKLLDAENHATGQQPRATLVTQLQAIIDGKD